MFRFESFEGFGSRQVCPVQVKLQQRLLTTEHDRWMMTKERVQREERWRERRTPEAQRGRTWWKKAPTQTEEWSSLLEEYEENKKEEGMSFPERLVRHNPGGFCSSRQNVLEEHELQNLFF